MHSVTALPAGLYLHCSWLNNQTALVVTDVIIHDTYIIFCCSTFKTACPAYTFVTVRKTGKLLIQEFKADHNHEISKEIFERYPEV